MKQSGLSEADFIAMLTQKKNDFYKIAYSYVRDEQDALDVVQDATCKAYVKLKSVKEPQFAVTWFTRILINTAITRIRKKAKRQKIQDFKELAYEERMLEEKWDLEKILSTLKPGQRDVIILKFQGEYTFQEMARILKKPENTVKSEFYRTLSLLKGKLGESYEI